MDSVQGPFTLSHQDLQVVAMPEPAAALLVLAGMVALVWSRWREVD